MLNNEFIQDKVKTLQVVRQWVESELTSLGVAPSVAVIQAPVIPVAPITPDPESENLRNSNGWLIMSMQEISHILKQPSDGKMSDLSKHA